MNDQAINEDKPEEIIVAENLATENKYTEAINVLREYVIKEDIPLYTKVYSLALQGRLLMYVGYFLNF